MKLIIGADLVPTNVNYELFSAADTTALAGEELVSLLKCADYRICNLEVPLSDQEDPIAKCGPALISPTQTVTGIKALGIDMVTIANNHIMDQGVQGFKSTLRTLENNGIAYVGGGKNLNEAIEPAIIHLDGKTIGIYACAEHEFSIAGEDHHGANPFDPLESPDHVAALKEQCDYVIVLYHGGKEHYRYPSPGLQKICRKLVEKGADLVLCQHSHCVGCEERYMGATIVYGQGNFLFNCDDDPMEQTSLLVQVSDGFSVSYIPLEKTTQGTHLAAGETAEQILSDFAARSMEIRDPEAMEQRYNDFADAVRQDYLTQLGGAENLLFRVFNKLLGNRLRRIRNKKRYPKQQCLKLRNYIECEAYRELLLWSLDRE